MKDTPRLFRIIIQVDDLKRAVGFYSALLGTPGRAVRGARHYFDCGPVILALLDPTQEESEARPLPDFIYFAVDDLEAVYARAADLGCLSKESIHGREPAGAILKRPWGERSFYAVDPFGNGLCFVDADTVFTGHAQSSSLGMPIVKLDDLLMAFEFVSAGALSENEAYLCRETGKIYWHSESADIEEELPEDVDSDKYISVPHKNDLDHGKRLVLTFAAEYLADDYDDVRQIFSRRGAYARFKDLLNRHGKLQQWHDYEDRAKKEALREWCQNNEIEIDWPGDE